MAVDTLNSAQDIASKIGDLILKNWDQESTSKTNGHTNGDTETNGNSNGTAEESKDEASDVKKEPDAAPGSISSATTIYKLKDEDGEINWTSEYPKDAVDAAENEETAKYAVVVRSQKSSDSRKKLEAHSIVIQSPQLKTVLGEVLKDYPGVSCELSRLVFEQPFAPFMHRWPELSEYGSRNKLDQVTKEHLDLLLGILKDELRDQIKAYEDYLLHGITTWDHAWMLFQPGGILVSESLGPLSAYELESTEYVELRCGWVLRLRVKIVEWNGSEFGKHVQYINIPKYKGVEKITNLSAYPLSFHSEKEKVRAVLIERGRKFEALAGHHFKSYTGTAVNYDEREGKEFIIHHDGRIVVDCKSFDQYSVWPRRYTQDFDAKDKEYLTRKRRSGHSRNVLLSDSEEGTGSAYELNDYHLLLCNCRVRGYSLVMKKWLDFFVNWVEEITWNTRAFDSLVLPEDQKELILAFTESQVRNRNGFDDVVSGKGQGIIILLSGKPGIGKTLTAESVAEAMKRPLHTISSGDLGSSSWQIEDKLTDILNLVGRWNAVLLLDECDVFLEARSSHDLERNAMVSTFLRVLEYYQGILFMTTNRADNIDQAFESRIHVSMQYPDLTSESRRKIWCNFLKTHDHAFSDADLDELAEIDLNGRQIKNILKTSHLLASRKKKKLSTQEVNTVLDIEKRRPERRVIESS